MNNRTVFLQKQKKPIFEIDNIIDDRIDDTDKCIVLKKERPIRTKNNTNTNQLTQPVKRQITENPLWNSVKTNEEQLTIIQILHHDTDADTDTDANMDFIKIVENQIKTKIRGYKAQDCEKNLYCEQSFITYKQTIGLLYESQLICFYCMKPSLLLYDYCHDSNQWTLERIENEYGHNYGNVVIACLSCNIKRKTMFYERFRSTKKICSQPIIKLS